MPKIKRTPVERILSRIEMVTESGCWIFMGALIGSGYGNLSADDGKTILAHRAMYLHFKGPIPIGKEIDHLCRVRCCCNPHHLEAVTRKVNIRRGRAMAATAERMARITHCPRGHPYSGDNLITQKTKRGGIHRGCRICIMVGKASAYRIKFPTVRRVNKPKA